MKLGNFLCTRLRTLERLGKVNTSLGWCIAPLAQFFKCNLPFRVPRGINSPCSKFQNTWSYFDISNNTWLRYHIHFSSLQTFYSSLIWSQLSWMVDLSGVFLRTSRENTWNLYILGGTNQCHNGSHGPLENPAAHPFSNITSHEAFLQPETHFYILRGFTFPVFLL